MPIVHGLDFNANQSELVKDLVRELLKDGDCAVYALHNMKPDGELRLAATPPSTGPRKARGIFLRIRPGVKQAIAVRPMNAKGGEKYTPIAKLTQAELLKTIRIWRKQTMVHVTTPETSSPSAQISHPSTNHQQL